MNQTLKIPFVRHVKRSLIYSIATLFSVIAKPQELPGPQDPNSWDKLRSMFSSKYIPISPNLNTGGLSLTIPLYLYKDQDFELPISINYVSGGYKTNDIIGNVGLGWQLNTGGIITRKVVGVHDESYGWPRSYKAFTSEKLEVDTDLFLKGQVAMDGIDRSSPHNFKMYTWMGKKNPDYETTPDIFTFNFFGHRGQFSLKSNGGFHIYNTSSPSGEYKIETLDLNTFFQIIITTGDGYKYVFQEYLYPSKLQYHNEPFNTWSDANYPDRWKLMQIIAPNGRKVVYEYSNLPDKIHNSRFTYNITLNWQGASLYTKNGLSYGYLNLAEFDYPLTKIIIDNTVIQFNYGKRKNEFFSHSKYQHGNIGTLSRLDSIVIESQLDEKKEIIKNCNFSYSYPSSSNSTNESYFGGRPVLFLKEIDISGEGKYGMNYYDETLSFPTLDQGVDHWGFFNKTLPQGIPDISFNEIGEESVNYEKTNYAPNFSGALMGMLKKITYPMGGHSNYYYEPNSYGYKHTRDVTSSNKQYLKKETGTTGGVRIKRIADYINAADSTYRDFFYHTLNNQNESSGILLHTPRYFYIKMEHYPYEWAWIDRFLSPFGDLLYTEDNTHIAYSAVTEKLSDNSYWQYAFSDYKSIPDLPCDRTIVRSYPDGKEKLSPSQIDNLEENYFSIYDSRHNERGKIISKKAYSSQNKLLYSEDYLYDYDKSLEYYITAQQSLFYYYMKKNFIESYPLKEKIKKTFTADGTSIVEKIRYRYNKFGQLILEENIINEDKTITTEYQYVDQYLLNTLFEDRGIFFKMSNMNIRKFPIILLRSIYDSYKRQYVIAYDYNRYTEIKEGFFSLKETMKAEMENPTSISAFHTNRWEYLKTDNQYTYDQSGRVIQTITKEGTCIVYLWSYGGQYPIAEIKNATYSEVKSALGWNESNISALQDQIILSDSYKKKIDDLRSSITLKNAHITTYTYRPLVGVLTTTDPSGITTYYDYDSLGNLKNIYHMGNGKKEILKTYEYNYQNK